MQALNLIASRVLDGDPRQVKVEAARRHVPTGGGRLGEILDQDLPRLDNCQLSAAPEMVAGVWSEHQRKTHHVQSISGMVGVFSAEFQRSGGKVGKAARYSA